MASRTPHTGGIAEKAVILSRADGWQLSAHSYLRTLERLDFPALRAATEGAVTLCETARLREEHLARCIAGDATVPEAWTQLAGVRADALITDPPYCLLTRRRRGGDLRDPKGKKNDSVRRFADLAEYRSFTRAWLERAAAHLKPDAPLVIWTNHLGKEPIRACARDLGWTKELGTFTWGKRSKDRNSGEETLRVVEVALVFCRPHGTFEVARRFDLLELGLQSPATPWAVVAGYDDDGEAARWGSHPNHKPFGVLDPLIRTWSRPGDLVLDPFAGSGSIPAAALKLGRRAYCIELDPAWAGRVTERLART